MTDCKRGLCLLCIFFAAVACAASSARAQSTTAWPDLAPAPPMGWASWNHYFCDYTAQTIRQQADALVSTGMRDLGYKYVLIQECIAPSRDAAGNLVVDPKRFPHGIKPLVDYIHSLGLKAGIYTDVGPYTCYKHPRYQGSYGHYQQDANTFAAWGIDLVEMDYCNKPPGQSGRKLYERMGRAIRRAGRPMVFYLCSWGKANPWEWAQGVAQLWRTTGDISGVKDHVDWKDVVRNFELNAQHSVFNAPNSWNDPDMLEVGNKGLSARESRTHFSMWAISGAPLWAGTDLANMDADTKAIYTNSEVIAVDQDPLGAGPEKISGSVDGPQVWAKPLGSRGSGEFAVLLLNLAEAQKTISIRWSNLGLLSHAQVRDLWSHHDLGNFADSYSAKIPPHGSRLLRVSGHFNWKQGTTLEAEWPGNGRVGNAKLLQCGDCSQGFAVALGGETTENPKAEMGSVIFRGVGVPKAGKYKMELTVVHEGVSGEAFRIQVNQGAPISAEAPHGASGRVTVPVALSGGENTIMVSASGKAPFDIDTIRIFR